jgi:hypothetical protein
LKKNKTGFQIPVFPKNRLKPVLEFLQKMQLKSKKIFTLILKYAFNIYGNTKIQNQIKKTTLKFLQNINFLKF